MRPWSLVLAWSAIACTAGTRGLQDQPPDASAAADQDAGAVRGDAGPPPDAAGNHDAAADGGSLSDATLAADACPVWPDQVAATGVMIEQAPLLARDGDEIILVYKTAVGIEVARLSSTLQLAPTLGLGHPLASDLSLQAVGLDQHLLWVDNSTTGSKLYDAILGGRRLEVPMGSTPHRIAATVTTPGTLFVAATGTGIGQSFELNAATDQFYEGRLHFDHEVYSPSESGAPLTVLGGGGWGSLAWLSTDGVYWARFFDAAVIASGPALTDPNGYTMMPGFQLLRRIASDGQEKLSLVVNDFGDRRANVHFFGLGDTVSHTLVQAYAGGVIEYSSSAAWWPERSAYVVAWPDSRESFATEGYYGHRRIYGTLLDQDGDFLFIDGAGGHPDLALSPAAPTVDALRPSLLPLDGERLLLAYVTSTGELHLTAGPIGCLAPVPDLP